MNNATNLATAVIILIAATLIAGATFSATTAQSAFAYQKKKGGTQDGGSKNGNTVTIEECKNRGSASGFDTALDQECENLICTHPGNNVICTQEEITSTPQIPTPTPTPTPTPEPTTGTLIVRKIVDCDASPTCSPPSTFTITVSSVENPMNHTFTGSESGTAVTLQPGQFFVAEEPVPAGFTVSFSGDCTAPAGSDTALGTIATGEIKTCTVTNTKTI